MFTTTFLLVVSLCLASGQRTDIDSNYCTYSFVVQSPNCWRDGNEGLGNEVATLRESVARLSARLADVEKEMHNVKAGPTTKISVVPEAPLVATIDNRAVYVYMGCPRDIYINIVTFVPVSLQPSTVRVVTVNFSESDDGQRVLLPPTIPPFPIFCTIDKYITIQRRRFPSALSFNRTWDEYKAGFGSVAGEFWLGLEKVYQITAQPNVKYSLRIELKRVGGAYVYGEYSDFHIADESQKYRIVSIGQRIVGSGGSYFLKVGQQFATRDRDQKYKCGARYNGFWYYENGNKQPIGCSQVNINADSTVHWHGIPATTELVEMKIKLQNV